MPMLIEHRVVYDGIQALNYSGSKELLKSPLHYQAYLTKTREDTKALRMGSYVHRLVLEPTAEATTPRFVKAPECDRRTKDGKAIFEAFTASIIAGQTIILKISDTTADLDLYLYSENDTVNPIKTSLKTTFISPTKNSQLVISFLKAFALASSIASGTLSTPITFFAFLETN